MASGLISRYAQVSGKPLLEVEKEWRTIKREFKDSGRKKEYDGCVRQLRERLGIKLTEGRRAYLLGDAAVEILSETPEYALVQVEDIGAVDDPGLRKMLFTSKGVITVQFDHLSNSPGGPPLTEMTTSAAIPMTAPSVTSFSTASVGSHSATASRPAAAPTLGHDDLDGIVIFRGRKAVVVSRAGGKARLRFLDTKEETDANETDLQPDSNAMESIARIWHSLDHQLSDLVKKRMFEAILKLEYSIAYLPEKLREDVEQMAKAVADNVPHGHRDNRGIQPEPDKGKFNFDDTDWDLIFKQRQDAEVKELEDREPMPEPPVEAPPESDGGQREGPPASKSIKPATDGQVHGLLDQMTAARESYQHLTGKVNLTEVTTLLTPVSDTVAEIKGFRREAPKSLIEKNLERAKHWESLFEDGP